jgi:hypothetical protein
MHAKPLLANVLCMSALRLLRDLKTSVILHVHCMKAAAAYSCRYNTKHMSGMGSVYLLTTRLLPTYNAIRLATSPVQPKHNRVHACAVQPHARGPPKPVCRATSHSFLSRQLPGPWSLPRMLLHTARSFPIRSGLKQYSCGDLNRGPRCTYVGPGKR